MQTRSSDRLFRLSFKHSHLFIMAHWHTQHTHTHREMKRVHNPERTNKIWNANAGCRQFKSPVGVWDVGVCVCVRLCVGERCAREMRCGQWKTKLKYKNTNFISGNAAIWDEINFSPFWEKAHGAPTLLRGAWACQIWSFSSTKNPKTDE